MQPPLDIRVFNTNLVASYSEIRQRQNAIAHNESYLGRDFCSRPFAIQLIYSYRVRTYYVGTCIIILNTWYFEN